MPGSRQVSAPGLWGPKSSYLERRARCPITTKPFAVRASSGPRPNPGAAWPPSQPCPAETVPTGRPLGGERPKVDQIGTKSKGKDQTKGQSHHPKGTNKIGTTDICHTDWRWQFSAKLQLCVGSDSKEPTEDPWQAQGRSGGMLVWAQVCTRVSKGGALRLLL